eukprot:352398-Chlamydomonas_euryale.AAC.6
MLNGGGCTERDSRWIGGVCVMLQLWTAQPPPAERIRRVQPAHTSPQRPPGAEGKVRHKGRKGTNKDTKRTRGMHDKRGKDRRKQDPRKVGGGKPATQQGHLAITSCAYNPLHCIAALFI